MGPKKELSVEQKHALCEHKKTVEEEGQKFPFSDARAYCEENFKISSSSSTFSRIWQGKEEWKRVMAQKTTSKAQRVRGAAWPEMEKSLMSLGQMWNTCSIIGFIRLSKDVDGKVQARVQSTMNRFLV